MFSLYCAAHGRDHENRIIARQEHHRQADETILIVHGTLIGNISYRCYDCIAAIDEGTAASLVRVFSRWADKDALAGYELDYERQFFDLETATVAAHGVSPCPGWPRRRTGSGYACPKT